MVWGNVFVCNIVEGDFIILLMCEFNVVKGDVKMMEKKVIWFVFSQIFVFVEFWDFDYFIIKDMLQEEDNMEDFLNFIIFIMEEVFCDEVMVQFKRNDIIQLERCGYYCVDKGFDDWKEGEEKRFVFFNILIGKIGFK